MRKNRSKNRGKTRKDANAFAEILDEVGAFAGPSVIWLGLVDKYEVAAIAFFWFVLCKAWAIRLRRGK